METVKKERKVVVPDREDYTEWLSMPVTKDFFGMLAADELMYRAGLSNGNTVGTVEEIGISTLKSSLIIAMYAELRQLFDGSNEDEGYNRLYPDEEVENEYSEDE